MPYRVTTIERDKEGNVYRYARPWLARRTLAATVNFLTRFRWVPGEQSDTGYTIIETEIVSEPEGTTP